jgi:hypothetical protein
MGDLPLGLAAGGQVAPIDTSSLWRFVATMAHTRIPSKSEVAAKVPIGSGPGGAFVRAQNGKPYIWASARPGRLRLLRHRVRGLQRAARPEPVQPHVLDRQPARQLVPEAGIGGPLTAAWSNPGESPASSTTGHMMGMVNGLTFESTGSRGVHLGASTRRLTDFAHIAHYAQGGQVGSGSMATATPADAAARLNLIQRHRLAPIRSRRHGVRG